MKHSISQDDIEKLEVLLKAKRQERKQANVLAAARQFVSETPIVYISRLDQYIIKDGNNDYVFIPPKSLPRTYSLFREKDFADAFVMAMEEAGRIYVDCTFSFIERPGVFNMLETTDWLQPVAGEHHWIFDLLIKSLGGNKRENMDHLCRVLAFKYLHPDCWRLPCIVIYGEGRAGKGLLVDVVLYTVFHRQTVSATNDNLVGDFNTLLKGRIVVLIDETVVGKGDKAKLYSLLGKERTTINEKSIKQYEVDNTALYLIGSNDWNGATLLDRSKADERLSILCVEQDQTLTYWIAQHTGWTEDQAWQWLQNEGGRILKDPEEVAHWLYNLLALYGDTEQPRALHGVDYVQVMDVQEKLDERIIEAVFSDEMFEYIRCVDLYVGYLVLCGERNNRFPISEKLFIRKATMWLAKHMPQIKKATKTFDRLLYVEGSTMKRRVQIRKTVWIKDSLTDFERDNRDRYIEAPEYGSKEVWIGPEV